MSLAVAPASSGLRSASGPVVTVDAGQADPLKAGTPKLISPLVAEWCLPWAIRFCPQNCCACKKLVRPLPQQLRAQSSPTHAKAAEHAGMPGQQPAASASGAGAAPQPGSPDPPQRADEGKGRASSCNGGGPAGASVSGGEGIGSRIRICAEGCGRQFTRAGVGGTEVETRGSN